MTPLTTLSLLVLMITLAAVPSASVALVVTRSATRGLANGAAVALGIVLGDLVFVALAILGMTVLAETMGAFFAAVKYLGGAYLIWLGVTLIRAKGRTKFQSDDHRPFTIFTSLASGFALTLGDVKAILFYSSLFPTFVDMTKLNSQSIAIIAAVTVISVGGVKLIYALLAQKIASSIQKTSSQKRARSTAGCLLIGSGAFLIAKT